MLEKSSKAMKIVDETSTFDIKVGNELSQLMKPNPKTWIECCSQLQKSFDDDWGGFDKPPKFPHPSILDFLFHIFYKASKSFDGEQSLKIALKTLKQIAMGGIHDHVGQVSIFKN